MHGHNPTELYFDEGKMRPHLIESLKKRWSHRCFLWRKPKGGEGRHSNALLFLFIAFADFQIQEVEWLNVLDAWSGFMWGVLVAWCQETEF